MDPLSIAASAVGFLAVSGACAKSLRRIIHTVTHAPSEIVALSNQLSDLNIVVNDIEVTCETLCSSPTPLPYTLNTLVAVKDHLQEARLKMAILEALVSEVYVCDPDTCPKFLRYKWMRKKSAAVALSKDFADIKNRLHFLWTSISNSRAFHIELSLASLKGITRNMLPSIDDSDSVSSNSEIRSQSTFAEDHMTDLSSFNSSTSCQSNYAMARMLDTVRQIGKFATIELQLHRIVKCDGFCDCDCHSRRTMQTPRSLHEVFGALLIVYAGLPMWTKACSEPSCTNQYSKAMQISYTFPSWLVSRTVDMVFGLTQTNEPCFGLKVRNRIDDGGENSIFQLARRGDTEGIIELFKQRKASANDITSRNGFTPIQYAVELSQIDAIQLLFDSGVDPYTQYDDGEYESHAFQLFHSLRYYSCDARFISAVILQKARRNMSRMNDFEAIFQKFGTGHAELWDFTFLHRVVVGELHASLEDVLRDPTRREELNAVDIRQRTPLFWASLRGDASAVEKLLEAGADVNIRADWNETVLHAAVQSGSNRCVELLLMAGCSIHARDKNDQTALQTTSWAFDDPEFLRTLVLAGASINCADYRGYTALHATACLNHYRNAAYLISLGVDINKRDWENETPLMEAMRSTAPDMVKLLLSAGADIKYVNKAGESVLHMAAMYGIIECMDALASFPLRGLALDARDRQGRTAREKFESRASKSRALEQAIARLFRKCEDDNVEDLPEDVFWDASE